MGFHNIVNVANGLPDASSTAVMWSLARDSNRGNGIDCQANSERLSSRLSLGQIALKTFIFY